MRRFGGREMRFASILGAALWIAPCIAHAHVIQSGSRGLGSGFAHPLTGPDHFLAMFAVGLWGAQMGGRRVWTLPVTFPLIMVIGGIMGIVGIPLPGTEIGIAVSIVALGSAIALRWRPAEWIALLLISVFAICHGYAHGRELPAAADPRPLARI
jgi:urease accessory protein